MVPSFLLKVSSNVDYVFEIEKRKRSQKMKRGSYAQSHVCGSCSKAKSMSKKEVNSKDLFPHTSRSRKIHWNRVDKVEGSKVEEDGNF